MDHGRKILFTSQILASRPEKGDTMGLQFYLDRFVMFFLKQIDLGFCDLFLIAHSDFRYISEDDCWEQINFLFRVGPGQFMLFVWPVSEDEMPITNLLSGEEALDYYRNILRWQLVPFPEAFPDLKIEDVI